MIGENVTLGVTIQKIVNSAINRLFERVRVQDVSDDRRVSVTSIDPNVNEAVPRKFVALKPNVEPGDDVVLLKTPSGTYLLGAIPKPGDVAKSYISDFGGDGAEGSAARSDHEHYGPGDQTLLGYGHPQHQGDTTGVVHVGHFSTPATDPHRSTVLGSYMQGIAARATAIGHWVRAGISGTAVGTGSDAFGASSVAVGDQAIATGIKSVAVGAGAQATSINGFAIGADAVNGAANTGKLRANDTYLEPSSGTGPNRFFMWNGSAYNSLEFNGFGDLIANGGAGVVVYRNQSLGLQWNNNKQISAGGTVTMRIAPGNVHSVIWNLGAGSQFWDSGIRQTTDEEWAYIMHPGLGFGWVPATRIIAN